jgi:hypothetical protein
VPHFNLGCSSNVTIEKKGVYVSELVNDATHLSACHDSDSLPVYLDQDTDFGDGNGKRQDRLHLHCSM